MKKDYVMNNLPCLSIFTNQIHWFLILNQIFFFFHHYFFSQKLKYTDLRVVGKSFIEIIDIIKSISRKDQDDFHFKSKAIGKDMFGSN